MPYICCDGNRYIGEHDCNQFHYGNQTMIRECCIADCLKWKETAKRVAMTNQHPAYRMYATAWNSLTVAERARVGMLKISVDGTLTEEPAKGTQ